MIFHTIADRYRRFQFKRMSENSQTITKQYLIDFRWLLSFPPQLFVFLVLTLSLSTIVVVTSVFVNMLLVSGIVSSSIVRSL